MIPVPTIDMNSRRVLIMLFPFLGFDVRSHHSELFGFAFMVPDGSLGSQGNQRDKTRVLGSFSWVRKKRDRHVYARTSLRLRQSLFCLGMRDTWVLGRGEARSSQGGDGDGAGDLFDSVCGGGIGFVGVGGVCRRVGCLCPGLALGRVGLEHCDVGLCSPFGLVCLCVGGFGGVQYAFACAAVA